ncbi:MULTISPECIES: tellurite resistance TerB family protein [Cyanophyceae]|uniref:tellurite resistance TerB family protein n=1 Tax=Cyanophyceae TaxID=3028117 RepID=UPI001686A8C5|nr:MULTISPECIES: tellurite resistance TerB family protein [Cyanophyceae]MBD1914563.1 tellurite resistance TerB family protein [Phormidium sp. FACHB-77]MBD2030287.1 tellurite resistance TerB family protein [Phormidium sp. FACHB-322]MBD2049833.1 tellurite resistance TerB family protein [Leptolyngbya sp. FACHB-60]
MTESSMGTAEALASIALVAIAADGYLADQEGQDMTMLLSRMALFSSYSKDAVHHLFDLLLTRLKTEGPVVMVDQAKAVLPQDLRETAFALATDLVLSDRTVTPQEQAFLEDLYRILEIPSSLAQQIVQVMTIKNRG